MIYRDHYIRWCDEYRSLCQVMWSIETITSGDMIYRDHYIRWCDEYILCKKRNAQVIMKFKINFILFLCKQNPVTLTKHNVYLFISIKYRSNTPFHEILLFDDGFWKYHEIFTCKWHFERYARESCFTYAPVCRVYEEGSLTCSIHFQRQFTDEFNMPRRRHRIREQGSIWNRKLHLFLQTFSLLT